MFFETGWVPSATAENDLMDFYVDDVSVTYNKSDLPDEEENDNLIELITNGDVETGKTTGWRSTPQEPDAKDEKNAVLAAVAEEGASGKYCLSVDGRKSNGMGACQDLSGKLEFGKTYTISGKLKYKTGPATKKFYVTIQNGDDYNWRENLVTINATKGEVLIPYMIRVKNSHLIQHRILSLLKHHGHKIQHQKMTRWHIISMISP